jgi:CAAX protease family protein
MTDQPFPVPPAAGQTPQEPFLRRISPVAFAFLSLLAVFLLYQFIAGGVVMIVARGKFTGENIGLVRWSTLAGQLFCILVPTLLLARARHSHLLEFLKIRLPHPKELVVTVIAVFALQQLAQGYMMAQDAIPLPESVQRLVDLFKQLFEQAYRMLVTADTPMEFVFVVITVALVPAVSEELLFRGLVQSSLEEAAGGLKGAIIAGVIFGAYHLNPFGFVPLVALGVFFGYIVYRSGNITLAIAAHFFNNFIACTALYLRLDDDFVALAPGGGASPSLVMANFLLFLLVFVAASYYFVVITRRTE